MSYLHHWQLQKNPFPAWRSTDDFLVRGSVEEAFARCDFLIQHQRRFGILVGPQGSGKTSFFQHLPHLSSDRTRRNFATVDFQGQSPQGLTESVLDALLGSHGPQDAIRSHSDRGTPSLSRQFLEIDGLLLASAAVGHTPILLFDRTEDASEEALETFGMILKRPGKWSAILAIEEEQLVDLPRKLLDACDLKIDLPAWDWNFTREFLEFSLSRAGANREIFTPQGIMRIHELSEGIAKVVEQLAEFALIAGAAQELPIIDAPVVDAVLDEFSLTLGPKFQLL